MRSKTETNGMKCRTEGVSTKARNITISPIKEMVSLASMIDNPVSLGWGLPSFETPLHIRQAVCEALLKDPTIGKYSDIRGIPELRYAIAEKFETECGCSIDPEKEILITVGAQQALFITLQTIIDPGDEVILISPGFSAHIDQVHLAGGIPIFVPLIEEEGWKLHLEDFKKSITSRTKAIMLNSPVNPTGSLLTETDLRAIADLACQYGFYIISDDTYNFIIYDDQKTFSLFSLSTLRDRLIGCFSFSKEYALTGWRVGYLCGEQTLLQEILKVHDASVAASPRISQVAALAALKGPQDCKYLFREELEQRRNLMCNRLDNLQNLFSYIIPYGAYYIFPKILIPDIDSFTFALKILNDAKVVTIPGNAFGPAGYGHLRLCFAVTQTEINEAFDRLERFVKTLKFS